MTSIDLGPAPKVVGRFTDTDFVFLATAPTYDNEFSVEAGWPIFSITVGDFIPEILVYGFDEWGRVSLITHSGLSDERPDGTSLAYVGRDIGTHGVSCGLSTPKNGCFGPVSVELN